MSEFESQLCPSPGTLGKVINLMEPLFSHLLNKNKIISSLLGLLRE